MYVATPKNFMLSDVDELEDEGLLRRPRTEAELDGALGLAGDEVGVLEGDNQIDRAEFEDGADGV